MAYQSLYRRYRPQRFAEVRGQEHLVRALRNAVVEGRVGHAYLFSGPRGTGKTSTARILAKVLNCEDPQDGEPCGTCASCRAIEAGASFDVHELDAASNNGVEAIRDLINKAALGTPGRTKVYILDEVHMLSAAASNALLKTLEEPPEHVVFVLATTDPQKVLPTIKSRTQHFEVHLLPGDDLAALIDFVVADAGLDVTADAKDYALRVGAGSARDALSALERVVAAGGVPDDEGAIDELVEALCDRDTGRALVAVERATNTGRGARAIAEALIGRVRDVFLASVHADLSRLPDHDRARVTTQADRLGAAGSIRVLDLLGEVFVGSRDAPDPRVLLEVALVRFTHAEADRSLDAILDRIERLERATAAGGVAARDGGARSGSRTGAPLPADGAADAAPRPVDDATRPVDDATGPGDEAPGPADRAPRPADEARRRLARTSSAPRRAPAARPAAPAARGTGRSEAAVPAPAAAEAAPGAMPDRDDLTIAWGDEILPALALKVRNRASGGRWLEVTADAAVFGLPSEQVAARFREVVGEVEEALARWHGGPVPVQVVLVPPDEASGPRARSAGDAVDPDPVEPIDPDELTDADGAAGSHLERLAEVFPGAELVEEG